MSHTQVPTPTNNATSGFRTLCIAVALLGLALTAALFADAMIHQTIYPQETARTQVETAQTPATRVDNAEQQAVK